MFCPGGHTAIVYINGPTLFLQNLRFVKFFMEDYNNSISFVFISYKIYYHYTSNFLYDRSNAIKINMLMWLLHYLFFIIIFKCDFI